MKTSIHKIAEMFDNLPYASSYNLIFGLNNSGQMKRFLNKKTKHISSCDLVNRDTMLGVINEKNLLGEYILFIAGIQNENNKNQKDSGKNVDVEEAK